jgi:MauM/NapG family ferredoxin protein
MGTLLDCSSVNHNRKSDLKLPDRLRLVKYGLLLTTLIFALFSNLSLLLFDPLTILYRTLGLSIIPTIDHLIRSTEATLYQFPSLQETIYRLDEFLRPAILPLDETHFRYALVSVLFFLVIIALNLVVPRFWCRYICPLGGLLSLLGKLSPFRRTVDSGCSKCDLCAISCPMNAIKHEQDYKSDSTECTFCLECMDACPKQVVSFSFSRPVISRKTYNPNRRQVFGLLAITVGTVLLARRDTSNKGVDKQRILPPGGFEPEFFSRCIRCGLCIRSCPTNGLQLALSESGWDGFFTPILVPRMGYCDHGCNTCGQVCPVGAISPLELEEKRKQVIGKAQIIQDRCIAWAEHRDCIVCEEMCPLPDKAIFLESTEIIDFDGEQKNILLPFVFSERCIGCGICENKCPVIGDAAIQIFAL